MTDRHWSIMTKSRGGTVSVLRDLTLAQAKEMYLRLDPEFGRTHMRLVHDNGSRQYYDSAAISDGRIEIREVFGPANWDPAEVKTWASEWPKFVDLDRNGKIVA